MIQVCYYKGCGVVYGEKEPLSDRRKTHGLCPKHLEISLQEMRAEMEILMHERGGLKVLIVEDSASFRQLFKETLHDRFPSIEIHEAVDGEEAFQEIETFRPDLIFMDIRLPGENGLELTKKVKARYPNIIVIILTGYDLPEYREFSLRYADYFFSKGSSTTENIFKLVESILSTSTQPKASSNQGCGL
jgi:CheY-like chemotaxis protein